MASRKETADFIVEQIAGAGAVSAKKMFGEYSIYCNVRITAFVADDQLFVKHTDAGEAFLKTWEDGAPYPGAKPHFHIPGEDWDDGAWLTELIKITAANLPLPPPKKPAKARPPKSRKTDGRS